MSFTLNRRSRKQLNKFAKSVLNNRERIEKDGNSFKIWGDEVILGARTTVGVNVNARGRVDTLTYFTVGLSDDDYDDQMLVFKVRKPAKTIKFIEKLMSGKGPSDMTFIDPTKPQLIADAWNENLPGLSGGPLDVYVSIGDYSAFA